MTVTDSQTLLVTTLVTEVALVLMIVVNTERIRRKFTQESVREHMVRLRLLAVALLFHAIYFYRYGYESPLSLFVHFWNVLTAIRFHFNIRENLYDMYRIPVHAFVVWMSNLVHFLPDLGVSDFNVVVSAVLVVMALFISQWSNVTIFQVETLVRDPANLSPTADVERYRDQI